MNAPQDVDNIQAGVFHILASYISGAHVKKVNCQRDVP